MKKLILLLLFIPLVFSCSSDDENSTNEAALSPVFLDSNGVTVKAKPDAKIGDFGIINGITYTIVSGTVLRDMIVNGTDVSSVCTSRITNMDNLFSGQKNFVGKIDSWDVSNVTSMERMFVGAQSFDSDISNWDVSKVRNMSGMFWNAYNFNQNITDWDVSSVTNTSLMFKYTEQFNQDISNWDVSKVDDMSEMFHYTFKFNQDISNWDVSNVNDMRSVFRSAKVFNQDLSSWDISGVNAFSAQLFCCNAPNWSKPKPKFLRLHFTGGGTNSSEVIPNPCIC